MQEDHLRIEGLKARVGLGLRDFEQGTLQKVSLDLDCFLPRKNWLEFHELSDTIDYSGLPDRLRQALAARRFGTMETLCEFIAQWLLTSFGYTKVRVTLTKSVFSCTVDRLAFTITRSQSKNSQIS